MNAYQSLHRVTDIRTASRDRCEVIALQEDNGTELEFYVHSFSAERARQVGTAFLKAAARFSPQEAVAPLMGPVVVPIASLAPDRSESFLDQVTRWGGTEAPEEQQDPAA